jgi:hypothetical protein
MEGPIVLKPGDVVAGVKLLDLLWHLIATDWHHRVQQVNVNHRSHTADLKMFIKFFQVPNILLVFHIVKATI